MNRHDFDPNLVDRCRSCGRGENDPAHNTPTNPEPIDAVEFKGFVSLTVFRHDNEFTAYIQPGDHRVSVRYPAALLEYPEAVAVWSRQIAHAVMRQWLDERLDGYYGPHPALTQETP